MSLLHRAVELTGILSGPAPWIKRICYSLFRVFCLIEGVHSLIDRRGRILILSAALYAFAFSLLFGLTNPPYEAPDEPAHLAYINHIIESRSLPNQLDPPSAVHGEGHQHPLYYIAAALIAGGANSGSSVVVLELVNEGPGRVAPGAPYLIFESPQDKLAFLILRAFGALLLSLLIIQIGRLAVALRIEPLWPLLLVSTLPQLLFISSAISNDIFTALLSGTAILSLIQWHQRRVDGLPHSARELFFAGLWAGAAFLAKKSALVLLPAACILIFLLWRQVKPPKVPQTSPVDGKGVTYFLLGWLLLAGPLLIRNQLIYGDPLASWVETYTLSHLVTERSLASSYFLQEFPMGVVSSFVGNFGWLSVQIPMRIVAIYVLVITPGLLGSLAGLRTKPALIFLWAVTGLSVAALVFYNLSFTQAQGRLLFPAIAAIACVWGAGMGSVVQSRALHMRWSILVGSLLILLDIYAVTLNMLAYR